MLRGRYRDITHELNCFKWNKWNTTNKKGDVWHSQMKFAWCKFQSAKIPLKFPGEKRRCKQNKNGAFRANRQWWQNTNSNVCAEQSSHSGTLIPECKCGEISAFHRGSHTRTKDQQKQVEHKWFSLQLAVARND